MAIESGNTALCCELLDGGADIEAIDNYGCTPLIIAAKDRNLDVCLALLDRGADIEAKDNRGNTPLIVAAKKRNIDVCLVLLDRGADIEAKDNNGNTPLIVAAKKRNLNVLLDPLDLDEDIEARRSLDLCLALLDRSAKTEEKNNDGSTPLYVATDSVRPDICSVLIDRGADIDAKDNNGTSILSCAISYIGDYEEIKRDYATDICLNLLEKGVTTTGEVEVNISQSRALLEYVALRGQGILLTKLLEADSDPKTLSARAAKALQISTEYNKHESMAILNSWISRQAAMAALAEFAEPTIESTSPQELAARSVELSMAKVISGCCAVDHEDPEIQTDGKQDKSSRKMSLTYPNTSVK